MMKKMLVGFALLSILSLQAGLTLAENGKSAYVIVLPDQAGTVEKRLAKEFQHHLSCHRGAAASDCREWRC